MREPSCQRCLALQAKVKRLEAYLTSLGIPLPTASFQALTHAPAETRFHTFGHRAPGALPSQQHVIATPDEALSVLDCVD